jgi:hypothetical protein
VSRYHRFDSGHEGVYYIHSFIKDDQIKIEIYFDGSVFDGDQALFEKLYQIRNKIENALGQTLSWEIYDGNNKGIALYRDGSLSYKDSKYIEIKEWSLNYIIKFKEVFNEYLDELRY